MVNVFFIILLEVMLSAISANLELLWTFDEQTFAHEVKRNSPTQDDSEGCKMTFGITKPNGFNGNTAAFDGSTFFDLRIDNLSPSNFAFSGWFRITLLSGTLFHYKPDDSSAQLKEIKVWVVEKQINFRRQLQTVNETDVCGSTMSENTWYYISFGIHKSSGTFWMYMDTSKVYDKDESYVDNVDLSLPGTLRVGGTLDGSWQLLTGYATCIAFHSAEFPGMSVTEPLCTSPSYGNLQPNCNGNPDLDPTKPNAMFQRYRSSTNNLEEFTAYDQCTLVSCAASCARCADCHHFQYENPVSSCSPCRLLKVGTGNTVSGNGAYYKLIRRSD